MPLYPTWPRIFKQACLTKHKWTPDYKLMYKHDYFFQKLLNFNTNVTTYIATGFDNEAFDVQTSNSYS